MVRVRVHHTDGVFRGGLLTVEHYPRTKYRTWEAPPQAAFTEALVFVEDDRWWLFQISRYPEFDRPEEDIDAFDAASKAIRYSDEDALGWFLVQKLRPPADLRDRIGATDHAPPAGQGIPESADQEDKGTQTTSRRERRYQWLAQALLIVRDEPHISNAEVARRVGVSASTLSRSKEFRAAAGIAREAIRPNVPLGFQHDDGEVEAVVDPTGKYERHYHRNALRNEPGRNY